MPHLSVATGRYTHIYVCICMYAYMYIYIILAQCRTRAFQPACLQTCMFVFVCMNMHTYILLAQCRTPAFQPVVHAYISMDTYIFMSACVCMYVC